MNFTIFIKLREGEGTIAAFKVAVRQLGESTITGNSNYFKGDKAVASFPVRKNGLEKETLISIVVVLSDIVLVERTMRDVQGNEERKYSGDRRETESVIV